MRICIVGHFDDNIQEGVRNVSIEIAKILKKKGVFVLTINISIRIPWKKINDFHPDIIHFVLTPTIGGLFVGKLTAYFCRDAKIVISAIHNSLNRSYFLRFLRPDLLIVQSKESEFFFNSLGYSTETIPNGVDINKFHPFEPNIKINLREKMDYRPDDFILLHLASFTKERNLSVLSNIIQRENCKILIIGREHEKIDPILVDELEKSGCRIEIKNFERIEEIYNIADCYIFPTIDKKACIETPLSVIEAMSCNLPVISTKFGALPDFFYRSINGLFFVDTEEDYIKFIRLLKLKKISVTTREAVVGYSWENIGDRLIKTYNKLILSKITR
jgi:glycosyltransferase involved in cell wall biosynthesis